VPQSTPSQSARESQSQGSHRPSSSKGGAAKEAGGGGSLTSLAWFVLKVRPLWYCAVTGNQLFREHNSLQHVTWLPVTIVEALTG
jgi:hypothetical protein